MSAKNIQFLRMTYLRGPNIWTYRSVIEALIDIGELEDFPSNLLPGFNDRLKAWLPQMIEHYCTPGVYGGFFQRLDNGTWAGHILEHVSLELQTRAGMSMSFGKAREAGPRGVYKVVIRTDHETVGRTSLEMARELILAAIHDTPYDVPSAIAKLTDLVDSLYVGPSTASIVEAAYERRVPYIRLNTGNLVQLGHGVNQRRIWTAETDRTSAIAEGISKDKDLTKNLLAMCGVPVPEGQVVDSPAAAWAAAQEIGLPVCVKPSDGNRARGVSLDLSSQADIEAAYAIALEQGSEVIVERFIRGSEHRLLVVGDRMVAASQGETASVIGDGQHTVLELVDLQINADPRRGSDGSLPLELVKLRENSPEVLELARQGLTPDSVPETGQTVLVKRTGNMTTDVTDVVHPDVAAQAVLAARMVGLDIAGVDVVTPDIRQPLGDQGVVVEVNAGPSLLMHLNPAVGQPRPVGQAIAEHLIPSKENGRIPLVGLIGDGDTTRSAKLIAWLLHLQGLYTGLACADGLYMNQRCLQTSKAMDFEQAERLLVNRSVQAAVFESDARRLLTQGLPYDRCQVGIVTSMPKAAPLEDLYPGPDDKMPSYIRTQIDLVLSNGYAVLNAADEAVADLAQYSDGGVILYAPDEFEARLSAHRAEGGRVGFWRDGQLILAEGSKEHAVLSIQRPAVARLLKTDTLSQSDMLIAACAAWAMDMGADLIRAGVKSYGQTSAA
ncbi:cyanophycin synthetase [Limnohabitans sp. MMS-10A-160]|uniref:cyanophycin synthetase n=1 Tax=unclassified Limnohabitans TaxID=2626134 RepID=UPI000D3D77D2|nr:MULTISPECIES: cyanophycin synthetase [unclassified Limnohabitans]PUE15873.1 cyanophycin synthetase [Limnohabitans sp. MMS-10A-192]PUE23887.1 cyanophycin synthetase [Limnohabitans sp. MMS-10A-160]